MIKLLIFSSPLLVLFLWWEHELALLPNSYNKKTCLIEHAAADCKVLVLGSSHAYYGINPAFFSQKGFNMANVSQSLYYDAEIAGRYLPHLPKLKYVVCQISYFSLEMQPLSQGEEAYRCPFYYRYYHLPAQRWVENCDIRNFSMIALYGLPDSVRFLKGRFKVDLAEHLTSNGWVSGWSEKPMVKNRKKMLAMSQERPALIIIMQSCRHPTSIAIAAIFSS